MFRQQSRDKHAGYDVSENEIFNYAGRESDKTYLCLNCNYKYFCARNAFVYVDEKPKSGDGSIYQFGNIQSRSFFTDVDRAFLSGIIKNIENNPSNYTFDCFAAGRTEMEQKVREIVQMCGCMDKA